MESAGHIISLAILKHREALYQIKNQSDISRTDLEVLAFAAEKVFFTYYDVEKFFNHTNCQQLRRSIRNLVSMKYVRMVSKRNSVINYAILTSGKRVLADYATHILTNI